jgi:hypothetical protein
VEQPSRDRGLILGAFLLLALGSSCATYTAVVEAPVEFWVTAENILVALVKDIWTVVEWLL